MGVGVDEITQEKYKVKREREVLGQPLDGCPHKRRIISVWEAEEQSEEDPRGG